MSRQPLIADERIQLKNLIKRLEHLRKYGNLAVAVLGLLESLLIGGLGINYIFQTERTSANGRISKSL